ncbi:hypothetical protein GF336_04810 [Candidatus Woesearchaeota archaeon]|nr:hypothetical protein [Candidatus Woesearchaeota archaeon]
MASDKSDKHNFKMNENKDIYVYKYDYIWDTPLLYFEESNEKLTDL